MHWSECRARECWARECWARECWHASAECQNGGRDETAKYYCNFIKTPKKSAYDWGDPVNFQNLKANQLGTDQDFGCNPDHL